MLATKVMEEKLLWILEVNELFVLCGHVLFNVFYVTLSVYPPGKTEKLA